MVVFDHATKLAYVVAWVHLDEYGSVEEAYLAGKRHLAQVGVQGLMRRALADSSWPWLTRAGLGWLLRPPMLGLAFLLLQW